MKNYLNCLETLTQEYDYISMCDLRFDKITVMRLRGLPEKALEDLPDDSLEATVERLAETVIAEAEKQAFRTIMKKEALLKIVREDAPCFSMTYPARDERNTIKLKVVWKSSYERIVTIEYRNYVTEDIKEYLMNDCFTGSGMIIVE